MLVSVYIRKADEDKWRKLPNKTEAISKLLNGTKLSGIKINETIENVKEIFPEAKPITYKKTGNWGA